MTTSLPTGRLAPSPTGELHLGHARSFLLAWWNARSQGGRVVLRIEDLDQARSRQDWIDICRRDLEWLGLDWDGPELLQSTRLDALQAAVEQLLSRGQAYPCTCSRKEIQSAQSAPHAGAELPYPGTCRGRWTSLHQAESETATPAGVRFQVPPGPIEWQDQFLGPQAHDVASLVGDFLIARRDGGFAYQLAVVVHDALQGVTEVLRADDLASSAPRQALLQDALNLPRPTWIHVPLVLDSTGERLAKRNAPLSLAALRSAKVDPRAITAWAARSAGLASPPRATPSDLLPTFSLTHLPKTPIHLSPTTITTLQSARL